MATKPVFIRVNESTLSPKAAAALADKRAADAVAKQYRAALEAELIVSAREKKLITAAETLAFGYNFGQLAVAIVPLATTTSKSAKNSITL